MSHRAASQNTAAADLGQTREVAPEPVLHLAPPALQAEDENSQEGPPTASGGFPSSIVALWPDGRLYAGDLLGDIVRYRDLRARALAGSCTTADDTSTLIALEMKLRQPLRRDRQPKERRFFRRYTCQFQARLEHAAAKEPMNVTVENVSAGGAKIRAEHSLHEGERVQLRVAVSTGDESRTVVFPSRVAWTADGILGLMFAGPPVRAVAEIVGGLP
jgi:hypothetical protein